MADYFNCPIKKLFNNGHTWEVKFASHGGELGFNGRGGLKCMRQPEIGDPNAQGPINGLKSA
jgi:hypothetical protein